MFGGGFTDWKKLSGLYILHRLDIYYDMQIIIDARQWTFQCWKKKKKNTSDGKQIYNLKLDLKTEKITYEPQEISAYI